MQGYELTDGVRRVRFAGELLAHASSRGHTVPLDALRWTEVSVYRTEAGAYVLHRVGRSRVYCLPDDASPTSTRADGRALWLAGERTLAACPVCSPPPLDVAGEVWLETDRVTLRVCDDAEGLVAAAPQASRSGEFTTRVTRAALDQAARRDPRLDEAWNTRVVA